MVAIDRKSLSAALHHLRHTVSTADDFPILQTVRFHDGTVTTFDGVVAMRASLPADGLAGCIPWQPLLQWVKSQKTATIDLEITDGWALLRTRGSELRLATLEGWPLPEWPTSFPSAAGLSAEWSAALATVAMCRGDDVNAAWRLGVTMEMGGSGVVFRASDNVTLAWASCPMSGPQESLILPPRLLDVLAAVKHAPDALAWSGRWLRFDFPAEGVEVIGLRSSVKPAVSRFACADPSDEWELPFVSLPKDFDARVKRICAVHRGSEAFRLKVAIERGVFGLEAVGAVAQSRELWVLDTGEHEPAETTIDGNRLAAVVGSMTEMRIAGGLVLLQGKSSTIVVWPLGTV